VRGLKEKIVLSLYHHGSSVCAAKVRFALGEKGLAWASHYVDILKGEQFTPEFLAINPKAVVPVLIHDREIIPESTVICEYIDEVFDDNRIFPHSPRLRASVRTWTKAVDEELHPACSAITYLASHRHTIVRNGIGNFEEFLKSAGTEGIAARTLKWQWIQNGLKAPGAADKIRLYDGYLKKMEDALSDNEWLVGEEFSMADIALAPYVNRLAALAMDELWRDGRLPNVERWFAQLQRRPTFKPAFVDWMPDELAQEMFSNGKKSWLEIKAIVEAA
jgi:ganglioside-induced differentiation-associated protein 1